MNTKVLTTLLSVLIAVAGVAQTGPASIGSTNGNSSMILWLDASQITGVYDSNNITTWEDLSGHGSDLIQNGQPNYIANFKNGHPAVRFNGNNEELNGTHTLTGAPVTIFSVFFIDKANQGSDDNDYIYSIGTNNSAGRQLSLTRRRGNDTGDEDKYYSWDGDSTHHGPSLSSQWYISTQSFSTTSTFHNLALNGTDQTLESDYQSPGLNNVNSDITLGNFAQFSGGTNNYLEGYIAEFIMFDEELNTAQVNIMENYLSAKYDIAIGGDLYAGDTNGNGDHDLDIAGIGAEANGSKQTANSAGLTITSNSGVETGDYLLLGHRFENNSSITTDIGEASNLIESRWERYWYLDNTDANGSMNVSLSFDVNDGGLGHTSLGSASDYRLIYRSSESGNWTIIATASAASGDVISFISPDVSQDGFYTVASVNNAASILGNNFTASFANNGPGGIESTDGNSDLLLWLDATRFNGIQDEFVVSWGDESGYGHSPAQSVLSRIPLLQTSVSAINNQNAVRFDEASNNSSGDYLDGTLSSGVSAPLSVIVVGYFESINQDDDDNDYLVSFGSQTSANSTFSISRRRLDEQPSPGGTDYPDAYYSWYGTDPPRFGPTISGQSWDIYMTTLGSVSAYHEFILNGLSQTVDDFTGSVSTNTDFSIGRWATGTSSYLDGSIAEVILFDFELNNAQRNILFNYLSGKYAISIASGIQLYLGDNPGNGDYDLNIAGIGQESDGQHASANSAGMIVTHSSGFEDGDYVLFGHSTTSNSVNTDDAAMSGVAEARSERDWYIDVTNGGATASVNLNFTFDISELELGYPNGHEGNYQLIYRSTAAENWSVVASGSSISEDQVLFSDVSISNDGFYTLSTFDQGASPLPIILSSFVATEAAEGINLIWSTETEINNDHFDIERSASGESFVTIGAVEGAGNSSVKLDYSFFDANPKLGSNYYRLKQTDYDGSFTYSPISFAFYNGSEFSISPNPVKNESLKIARTESGEGTISIIDLFGREVFLHKLNSELRVERLNIGSLPKGIYMVRYAGEGRASEQRLIVR
ncbi:MAG: T9SS type A sorting domain-containing protein [Cyclobacteriaceae bacterium]